MSTSKTHTATRAIGACLAAVLLASVLAAGAPSKTANPECIEVWGEARYRNYGYDHIVHVNNRCAQAAVCDVSSDVNPSTQRVTVPVGEEIEVLTFRGSPSREFAPRAECHLGAPAR